MARAGVGGKQKPRAWAFGEGKGALQAAASARGNQRLRFAAVRMFGEILGAGLLQAAASARKRPCWLGSRLGRFRSRLCWLSGLK